MGTGASVARGLEAYIFINESGNGHEIEQWWMDQGYLVHYLSQEPSMEDIESPTDSSESTEDTQENMLRHEVPYYSREEVEEFFPAAPSRISAIPPFPPNISTEDAENMSISIADADALWTEWWNSRSENIEYIGVPSLRICYRRCCRRRNSLSTPRSQANSEGREFIEGMGDDADEMNDDTDSDSHFTDIERHTLRPDPSYDYASHNNSRINDHEPADHHPNTDEMSDDIERRLYGSDSDSL